MHIHGPLPWNCSKWRCRVAVLQTGDTYSPTASITTHLEFDVHLFPRADCTGNISTCWFFALRGNRCFSMTGNHIYLPRMGANTICNYNSLLTSTLSIMKVDFPVIKSKIYSSCADKNRWGIRSWGLLPQMKEHKFLRLLDPWRRSRYVPSTHRK